MPPNHAAAVRRFCAEHLRALAGDETAVVPFLSAVSFLDRAAPGQQLADALALIKERHFPLLQVMRLTGDDEARAVRRIERAAALLAVYYSRHAVAIARAEASVQEAEPADA